MITDLVVPLNGVVVVIEKRVIDHPLLGRAHPVCGTFVSAWRDDEIPAIAEPGKLPPGAGGAIINALARRAADAGIPALRYAGPYPTPALFATLLRSFRTTATEAAFTRDLVARMARLARDPIPIDFVPAPHRRVEHGRDHLEIRDGAIERAVIDGVAYARGDHGIARIVDEVAEIHFGDRLYARAARLAPFDKLAIPAYASPMIGREFPAQLREALAEIVAELVPAPLRDAAHGIVAYTSLTWADLGPRAAARTEMGFAIHAVLWDRLAPLGLARVAQALAEALAPVVTHSLAIAVMSTP